MARDLNNLAQLLQATNRLDEAEPLIRRALKINEASFGSHHPTVAIRLNNLAQLLKATNRLDEAEPLIRRALKIDEASFGPHHPKVAIRLNNLALLLKATNRLDEAEPLMRRALKIDEASFGPDHPTVAIDLNNLAQLLEATNRLDEAEPLYLRALEIDEKSNGPRHPDTMIDAWNLLLLYLDTGNTTAFSAVLPKLTWLLEEDLNLRSADLQTIRDGLHQLMAMQNQPTNQPDPNLQQAQSLLAENDWQAAAWYYKQSLAENPEPSPAKAQRQNMLALTQIKQEKGHHALAPLDQALTYYQENQPLAPIIGTLYNNLGSAYKTMGQWAEARLWLCRAVDWTLDNESPNLPAYTHGHLCRVLFQLGDHHTSVFHGEKSLAYCLQSNNHTRARETVQALVDVYRALGRHQRVEELLRMAESWPQQ